MDYGRGLDIHLEVGGGGFLIVGVPEAQAKGLFKGT